MEIKVRYVTMDAFQKLGKFLKSEKNVISDELAPNIFEVNILINLIESVSTFCDKTGKITFGLLLHINDNHCYKKEIKKARNSLFNILDKE